MRDWLNQLKYDPLPQLLSRNEAITYFAKRDLLKEGIAPAEALWKLPSVEKILGKQQGDGSWKYHGGRGHIRSQENYSQIETYRILGLLVEKYGLNRDHPSIRKSSEFLFNFQTIEGDFRGIYGNQHTPNYSAAIMELLIKAGYEDDCRIKKGFGWLFSTRQDDGGWAIPVRTRRIPLNAKTMNGVVIAPDPSKPFSHLVTGIVLRAFAASGKYAKSREAIKAGNLLALRFFRRDPYPDRNTSLYWESISFPFWFTDIVSSLDSLSLLGFSEEEAPIRNALTWLKERQREDGLFELKLLRGKDKDIEWWVALAICRIFKRFYG